MALNFKMNELDQVKKNAGLNETPLSDLPTEANEQLAKDLEKIAENAYRVADSLRLRNKKLFATAWDDFSYLAKRTMHQINQRYR